MFSELTALILEGIKSHGLLAVIIGVAIETLVVPLPSPIIVMAAGYILIPQGTIINILLGAAWISVVAGAAQTIGSFLLYLPGYYVGKPFIEKYEKFHGVSWKEVQQFQKKFSKGRKEDLTLFLLRLIPIMPLSVISGLAGIMKFDIKRYALFTFLGVVPRNMILAFAGFSLGEVYMVMASRIDYAETVMTALFVFLILAYIVGHKTGLFSKMRKEILK